MTAAVHARDLKKSYGSFPAVLGIDLEIPVGECYGLLGVNGAGKTTTIKMVTCTSPPTSGVLEVLGLDARRDRRAIKGRLGVVPQGMTLDNDLTVLENLRVHGVYHGIPVREATRRAEDLLDFARLAGRANERVNELSGGMQRRLLIARALMNEPELVVLDEPTTGLDPQGRHMVWERLRGLKRQGKTLLLTTHYMEEAERLCDRLAVMDQGRIIAEGSPSDLIRRHVAPHVVEIHGDILPIDEVHAILTDGVEDIEQVGDRILVYGVDGESIAGRIRAAEVPHEALMLRDATLEDVFLRLVGHALAEQ